MTEVKAWGAEEGADLKSSEGAVGLQGPGAGRSLVLPPASSCGKEEQAPPSLLSLACFLFSALWTLVRRGVGAGRGLSE